MNEEYQPTTTRIIWVFPGSLHINLDASTWLETTRHLRDMGCQVVLIQAGPQEIKSLQGVDVISIPKPNVYLIRQAIFHFRVYREIARRWRTSDIILYHHHSFLWLIPWRMFRSLTGRARPLFVKDTRTAPMIPNEMGTRRDRVRNAYDNVINRLANSFNDGQTAITKRMAQMMRIPDDQLLGVWPSGVDLEEFSDARQNRDWDAVNDNIDIIYVGALHQQRNLLNFSKAVKLANESRERFTFTMVGDGTGARELSDFALETNGRIRVLPPIPHNQVPDLLAQAHVGVLPFPDQERFRVSSPIKLFEYMASGMPILATHIACHTDVVGNGQYAFWAYDEDVQGLHAALESLWEQRTTLQEKGREAGAAANDWTWEASAKKLDTALRRGLDSSDRVELQAELFGKSE